MPRSIKKGPYVFHRLLEKIEKSLNERRDFLEELLDDVFDDERLLIEEELNEISESLESIKIRRNQINDEIWLSSYLIFDFPLKTRIYLFSSKM